MIFDADKDRKNNKRTACKSTKKHGVNKDQLGDVGMIFIIYIDTNQQI